MEAKFCRTKVKSPTKLDEHVTIGMDGETYKVFREAAQELGVTLSELGRVCIAFSVPGLDPSVLLASYPKVGFAIKEKISLQKV